MQTAFVCPDVCYHVVHVHGIKGQKECYLSLPRALCTKAGNSDNENVLVVILFDLL